MDSGVKIKVQDRAAFVFRDGSFPEISAQKLELVLPLMETKTLSSP